MDGQKRASSPSPILLEPSFAERTGLPDAWPKHGRSKKGPSGGRENLWIPAGKRVDSRQKDDSENTEQLRGAILSGQPPLGRRSAGSLRELAGNSTPELQIQVISPRKLTGAASCEAPKNDERENENELRAAAPFVELARVGTPDQGPTRGSASLFRPLSSTRRLLHSSSRPGSSQSDRVAKLVAADWFISSSSRPQSRQNRHLPDGESLLDVEDPSNAKGDQRRDRTSDEFLDTAGVQRGNDSNSRDETIAQGSRDALSERRRSTEAALDARHPSNGRRSSPEKQGTQKRAQSAFSFYPTSLEEGPTSRWHIDSASDSLLFEELVRLAGHRPATSLGLQSPRNELYQGKHSSEIWGSLSDRARKLAQGKEDKKQQRRELLAPAPVNADLGSLTPQLRARTAPAAFEGTTRARDASLWTWHAPADRMLNKAQSTVARRLRQEIELYRENSFQREDLEARVEKQKEAAQQQRRRSFDEVGSIPERNRQNLGQHQPDQRMKRTKERARAHRERWAQVMERHVARQRKEEEARDELILMQATQQEEDQAAADKEKLERFILERRRWWTTLIALGSRLQLLAETVRVQRDVRFWQQLRERAARRIQVWFRKTQARLLGRRRTAAAKKIQSFVRRVVLGRKEARQRRYAGLIALFLSDMQRSQALMLAFRTFRQRVMTIQHIVGLRSLRVRAQVALVLRQWEVAEENWIKTNELAATRTRAPGRASARARSRTGSSGGSADNSGSTSYRASNTAAAGSKRPSARASEKGLAKTLPKGAKSTNLSSGDIHRLLFDLRDGVLGPEYASSGIHVPREIQESVVKDFCMRKRRAHVKNLEQYKVQKVEEDKKMKEKEALQRTRRFLQGKMDTESKKQVGSLQVPRLRVLAIRKELQAMMLEGLAKAAIEAITNVETDPSLAQSLSSAPSSGKATPVASRRGTREVHVMAAISEMDLTAHFPGTVDLTAPIPRTVNLMAADSAAAGQSKRRETRRGTNRKVVTWDTEVAPPP